VTYRLGTGILKSFFYGVVGPHSAASKESGFKVKFMKAVFSIWVGYKIYRLRTTFPNHITYIGE
jgi:hypothetical protein